MLIDGGRGTCNTVLRRQSHRCNFPFADPATKRWVDASSSLTAKCSPGETSSARMFECWPRTLRCRTFRRDEVLAHYRRRPGLLRGSARAAARVLRSREFRQLLLQIPVSERVLSKAWQWLESLNEQQRASVRARLGVRRQTTQPARQRSRTFPMKSPSLPRPEQSFFASRRPRNSSATSPVPHSRRVCAWWSNGSVMPLISMMSPPPVMLPG